MNKLTTAVWEITMGCNMRCKHCGSSCAEALPDELNTSEALEVCDQLKDLGLKVITLSGGEPTTRSDWHIIAKRLVDNGIITSIITNGWLIDENFIHNAITSGIRSVCLRPLVLFFNFKFICTLVLLINISLLISGIDNSSDDSTLHAYRKTRRTEVLRVSYMFGHNVTLR